MVEQANDILQSSGLDTLSEVTLRRMTERWTGSLQPADTLLDASSQSHVASSSTFHNIVDKWRQAREVYHDSSVHSILGENTTYAEGVMPVADVPVAESSTDIEVLLSATESGIGEWMPLLYNVLIAIAVIYYMFCMYRYFDDVIVLFRSVFQRQVVMVDRAQERRRSDIFYGSLGKLFILGMVLVGILSAVALWRSDSGFEPSQLFYMPVVVVALFIVVVIAQYVVLLMVGFVTHSMYEVSALMRIRLIYFVMAVVMVAPALLISQMGDGESYLGWLKVGSMAALLVFVLFIRESVSFFISKKVSILHWILYLCAVEILPLSLLWQGVVRLT